VVRAFDEDRYREFFRQLTGHAPFDYQVRVGRLLCEGKNIVLRAPTGAGKTWSVLVPFLFPEWKEAPARLIYALPLRTLAQGVYREARETARRLGLAVEGEQDGRGREVVSPFVTLQTGEQPDDRFFDRGRIIVTTYDQLLSGLLDGPYGLSDRLHNVNAAAVAGSVVVFDEFHLMEPQKAFLTAVAGLHLFRDLCQSVWMTATATRSLENVLQEALDTVSVPATEAETERLLDSLPSVTEVTRHFAVESEPLSAESVLRCHRGRSVVLLNTVGRAQAMFGALRMHLEAEKSSIPLILLHSRFFKEDRRAKEERLQSLLGKGTKGPAILVATQVVEAGIDISCDHLHTELCPMNALVQRAGRCARFAGEAGTVHVHPMPPEERAWLPYGNLSHEDITLTGTRELLERVGHASLHPHQAVEWVQQVHGADDEQALREGWRSRLITCLRRIEQNAILRDPKRVADLIRGEDTDSIRVIINEETTRPDVPGKREGLSLSRWTIARLFRNGASDIGWFWNGSDSEPWKALRATEDLKRTYVVCLRPMVAAYDGEVGLRLGTAGTQESLSRVEPKRPGYAPLKAEAWSDHVRRVADEAKRRLERERLDYGFLGSGFEKRYGLSPQAFREGLVACALLHDLGKLQVGWQRWAEAAQRAKDPGYRHVVPLAHTDFDPDKPEDRERERSTGIRRPAHAPAGAFYSGALLARLLSSAPEEERTRFASACAAAILAHHGGWLPEYLDLGISGFWDGWEQPLADVLGWVPQTFVLHLQKLQSHKDKRGAVQDLLNVTTNPEGLAEYWPLVAYLTRTLRLSDQRATAEGASHE
jgi:CRISPR-associated endonuclease/helicase Cas3